MSRRSNGPLSQPCAGRTVAFFHAQRGTFPGIAAKRIILVNTSGKGTQRLGGRNLLRYGKNVISLAPYGYSQEKCILSPSS